MTSTERKASWRIIRLGRGLRGGGSKMGDVETAVSLVADLVDDSFELLHMLLG